MPRTIIRPIVATISTLFWTIFILYCLVVLHPPLPYSIVPVCWLIVLVYWWVSALRVKAVAEKQKVATALTHQIPFFASLVLLADPRLPYPMNAQLFPRIPVLMWAGIAICVLGVCETIWARWTLAGNWSGEVTFKVGHELIRTGPYRFTRHPIYTGLLMMSLGTAIVIDSPRGFLALVLMAIAFWIKLKQEEGLMMQHFPGQYPAYRKEVKALVPFII